MIGSGGGADFSRGLLNPRPDRPRPPPSRGGRGTRSRARALPPICHGHTKLFGKLCRPSLADRFKFPSPQVLTLVLTLTSLLCVESCWTALHCRERWNLKFLWKKTRRTKPYENTLLVSAAVPFLPSFPPLFSRGLAGAILTHFRPYYLFTEEREREREERRGEGHFLPSFLPSFLPCPKVSGHKSEDLAVFAAAAAAIVHSISSPKQ